MHAPHPAPGIEPQGAPELGHGPLAGGQVKLLIQAQVDPPAPSETHCCPAGHGPQEVTFVKVTLAPTHVCPVPQFSELVGLQNAPPKPG